MSQFYARLILFFALLVQHRLPLPLDLHRDVAGPVGGIIEGASLFHLNCKLRLFIGYRYLPVKSVVLVGQLSQPIRHEEFLLLTLFEQ
jgi:hypothetical protein